MYSVFENNKYYIRFAHIKPIYRYAITTGIMGVIAAGWYWGIYHPLHTVIAQHKAYTMLHESQISAYNQIEKKYTKKTYEVARLESSLKSACAQQRYMHHEQFVSTLLEHIMQLPIQLQSYKITTAKEAPYSIKYRADLSIKGSLQSLMQCIEELGSRCMINIGQHCNLIYEKDGEFLLHGRWYAQTFKMSV
jgi:hypothetical protein